MASNETSFLVMLVKKCISMDSVRFGRQLHALVFTSVFNPTPFLNNNLITMYAKCGHQEDARKVFDRMPLRNVVSWNTLLSSYSRTAHHALSALELFRNMLDQGFQPNSSTFSSLLQAASSLADEQNGPAIHSQVIKSGFLKDLCMQTSLLGMYSNCRDLNSATQIFQNMTCRDTISWNSIISGNIKNNRIRPGLQLYSRMLSTNPSPNQFTFSMVLNACSRSEDQAVGEIIHAQIIKQDFPIDTPLQNALVDMYSSFGNPETCFSIFRKITNPDLVSWNSMLGSYSHNADGEEAMDLFIQMRNNTTEKPDEYSFAAIVSATGGLPAQNYGKPLHAQVTKVGFESDIFVGSTLINMYFKNGETESARKLFNSMPEKDVILWGEMITGHSSSNECENAVKYFYQMLKEGHKPDSFAFSSVLNGCAQIAAFRQGEIIHSQVVKTGYEEDMFTCTSLVDMYSKNGSLKNTISVFSRVEDPDLECWNSMLGGYSHHGNPDQAFKLFDKMVIKGIKPDYVTFISLLSACSYCGLVERGKFYWNYMTEKSGLLPGPKHYACMVSLLSRVGLLQEAEELIGKSTFANGFPELWRILLSSCVMHSDLEMGVRAGAHVLISEPEDSATLILLSNLYAAAGRWSDVAESRRKIRGLEKDPGLSWFEIKNKFHIFSAGDETHPQIHNVRTELQRLQRNMKESETVDAGLTQIKTNQGHICRK